MTECIIHVTITDPDGALRPVGRVVYRPGGKAACDAVIEPGLGRDTVRFTLAGMAILAQGLRPVLIGGDPDGVGGLVLDNQCRPVASDAQVETLARLLARLQSRTAAETRALPVTYLDWERRDDRDRQAMRELAAGMLDTVREAG